MTLLLELNDLGIRCYQDGRCLHQSPGVAVVNSQLLFGEEALNQCRRHPLNTHSHFWSRLNTEPSQFNHPRVRHNADLAFLHLQHIESQLPLAYIDQPVIFSLPAATSRDSLGLLLGISQQCGLKPLGLVDQALAAALPYVRHERCWHVEMHLHHTQITELQTNNQQLQYVASDSLADVGWLSLQSQLLKQFSDWFIQQTRFNPRYDADTEQALFNAIPDWLRQCQSHTADTLICELGQHHIQLETHQITEAIQAVMHPLHQRLAALWDTQQLADAQVLIGDRLCEWASLLLPATLQWQPLPASAAMDSLPKIQRELTEHADGVRLIRQLPCELSKTTPVTSGAQVATHVLYQHHAYPLTGHYSLCANGQLQPGTQTESLLTLKQGELHSHSHSLHSHSHSMSPQSLLLNNRPYDHSLPLHVGDQLQLGEFKLTLIRVEP